MPNTPALIGKGMIALAASPEVTAEKISELENILGGAGIVDTVDERYMDAVTGLSGSGPAYVYMFIEALADGAVHAGLPRDKALRYAAQTVLGSAAMVQETGKHPGELKDMVTSPGGTTIAGVAALENGAFRGTVMKAVKAASKRSVELG
jgi:pyrroline-5-carboxylate reductase